MNSFTNPCLPNQPARMLRAGIAAALLVCATGGGAVESISWDFYSGGFDKGGSTTNGIPVTDSAADSDGYVGTVNAALDWSDISVRSRVPSSYGQSTTAGSTRDYWVYNRPGRSGPVTITVTPYVFVRS